MNIKESSIGRITRAAPAILGLSLEHNLRPTVAAIKERCNLTNDELAALIITVPSILTLSLKKKIEPCFDFLTSELRLTSNELGAFIQSCPRILMHGLETSVSPKIQMVRDALVIEGAHVEQAAIDASTILKMNPGLLATTNSILRSRIDKYLSDPDTTITEALRPRAVGRKRLVKVDAEDKIRKSSPSPKRRALIEVIDDHARMHFDDLKASPLTLYDNESDSVSLIAFAAGCIYPSDDINLVRGGRKAAGISIQLPQVSHTVGLLEDKFQEATRMSFGMIMPHGDTNPRDGGLVQAGFPFLRPSRNRCDLYACHGALKVILQLLKQAAEERDMRNTDVNIQIYTDSTYAWKLLKDSGDLLEWGSATSQAEVTFDVDGPLPLANPDLLFPLTKTMHRMSNNAVVNRRRNERLCIGRNVSIAFRYTGDLRYDKENGRRSRDLRNSAKEAAIWQFNKG